MKKTIGKFLGVEVVVTEQGVLLDCKGSNEAKTRVIELLKNIDKLPKKTWHPPEYEVGY